MKKVISVALGLIFTGFISQVQAQDEKIKDKKKETQEIIIRSKGDKESKIVVEIKGDKVTINGKPLVEFKDDNIIINKRNITVFDRSRQNYALAEGKYLDNLNFFDDAREETRAFLGVTTEDFDNGAKITEIAKESAAEKAGLKVGDIITKINDKKIDGPESLLKEITNMKPADGVTVYYKRDGSENQVKAILGERKESGAMFYSFSGPDGSSRSYTIPSVPRVPRVPRAPSIQSYPRSRSLGENNLRELEALSPDFDSRFESYNNIFARPQKLGIKIQDTEEGNGVKILDVDKESPADKAGLKKDDIVTEVGGKKVSNTDDAREQLQDSQEKSSYTIKARRNGNEMSFDIKIPKKLKTANL